MKFANLVEICLWPHLAVKGLLYNFKQAVSLENEPDDEVNVATKQRERAANVPFLQCVGNETASCTSKQTFKKLEHDTELFTGQEAILWFHGYPV